MEIKDLVRKYYDSTKYAQQTKKRAVVEEVRVNYFLYYALTKKSLRSVAELFGRTDHATVNSGIRRVRNLYETDSTYRKRFNTLVKELGENGYDTTKVIDLLNKGTGGKNIATDVCGIDDMSKVREIVRRHFDSSMYDQSSRKREVVQERRVNFFLYKTLTNMSLEEIAGEFDRTSHVGVTNGVSDVKNLYETNREYQERFDRLIKDLEENGYDTQKITKTLKQSYGRKNNSARVKPRDTNNQEVRQGQE